MSSAHTRASEVQKTIEPVRQPEPELIRRQEQGSAHAVAPQVAFRRVQLNRNGLRPAELLALQRAVGNRAVQRMLAKANDEQGDENAEEDSERTVQTKLTADAPAGVHRQEADGVAGQVMTLPEAATKRPNRTGLPDGLKAGVESLSGMSLDSVRVHYNSSQPARLTALAYAQGSDIHVAPGQEQHLPHEAWHVVQQAQGQVKPTMQMKDGVPINDDQGLEREADVMGGRAAQLKGGGHDSELVSGQERHPRRKGWSVTPTMPAPRVSIIQRDLPSSKQEWDSIIKQNSPRTPDNWIALLKYLDSKYTYKSDPTNGTVEINGATSLHPAKLLELAQEGTLHEVIAGSKGVGPKKPLEKTHPLIKSDGMRLRFDYQLVEGVQEFIEKWIPQAHRTQPPFSNLSLDDRRRLFDLVNDPTDDALKSGAAEYALNYQRSTTIRIFANHYTFFLASAATKSKKRPDPAQVQKDYEQQANPHLTQTFERSKMGGIHGMAPADVVAAVRSAATRLNFESLPSAISHAQKHPLNPQLPFNLDQYVNWARLTIQKGVAGKVVRNQFDAGWSIEFSYDDHSLFVNIDENEQAYIATYSPRYDATLAGEIAEADQAVYEAAGASQGRLAASSPTAFTERDAAKAVVDRCIEIRRRVLTSDFELTGEGLDSKKRANLNLRHIPTDRKSKLIIHLHRNQSSHNSESADEMVVGLPTKAAKAPGEVLDIVCKYMLTSSLGTDLGAKLKMPGDAIIWRGKSQVMSEGELGQLLVKAAAAYTQAKSSFKDCGTILKASLDKLEIPQGKYDSWILQMEVFLQHTQLALLAVQGSVAKAPSTTPVPAYLPKDQRKLEEFLRLVRRILAALHFTKYVQEEVPKLQAGPSGQRRSAVNPELIRHLIEVEPNTLSDFRGNGVSGGHQEQSLLNFSKNYPRYQFVLQKEKDFGGLKLKYYKQYMWKDQLNSPTDSDIRTLHSASSTNSVDSGKWEEAQVGKSTADDLMAYLRQGDEALNAWTDFDPHGPASQRFGREGYLGATQDPNAPKSAAGIEYMGRLELIKDRWHFATLVPHVESILL